jgi:hypothetical protein
MTTTNNALLVFANLTADRERRISEYQSLHGVERWEAAMAVDLDAPSTTNWEMLKMIGVDPATASLTDIINGLACWNVYLSNTNHLSDDDLLHHLQTKILLETVTLIPPNADMEEHIGMNNFDDLPPVSNRDASLPRPYRTANIPNEFV